MDAVLTIRTGAMGSGKSYGVVYDLIYKYAVDRTGPIIHNLPLHHDEIVKLAKIPGLAERLYKIDDETIQTWKESGNGPWIFTRENFMPADLAGGMILLDEVHHYMGGQRYKASHNQHWLEWLSMVRHEQCEVVLITQAWDNFPKWVRSLCELKVEVASVFGKRLPWALGAITVGDIRQLWAGLTRTSLVTGAWLLEYRKAGSRWSLSEERPMTFVQPIFDCYKSHSATDKGTGGAERVEEPCERFSRFGILMWFIKRNWWRLGRPVALIGALILLPCFTLYIGTPEGRDTMVKLLLNSVKPVQAPPIKPQPKPPVRPSTAIAAIECVEVKSITSTNQSTETSLPGLPVRIPDPPWVPPLIVGMGEGWICDENGEHYREGDQHHGVALAWIGIRSWSWTGQPVERLRRRRPVITDDSIESKSGPSTPDRTHSRVRTDSDSQRGMGLGSGVGGVSRTGEPVAPINRRLGEGRVPPGDVRPDSPIAGNPRTGGQIR